MGNVVADGLHYVDKDGNRVWVSGDQLLAQVRRDRADARRSVLQTNKIAAQNLSRVRGELEAENRQLRKLVDLQSKALADLHRDVLALRKAMPPTLRVAS